MKLALATAAAALTALASPAAAQSYTPEQKVQIVERNAQGKATKVSVGGVVYAVCLTESQDACINPRAAGLSWGDRPLGYWPGETDVKVASR